MGSRKALLIGIERYGEGFAPLPAVTQDMALVRATLEASGYEVKQCPSEALANATTLDSHIRVFCADGEKDDIRIVYFTGHGIRADDADWIVPEGTSRNNAFSSPNQRVSTDLSSTVASSRVGLVLFIIDACRDPGDRSTTKGAAGWGDPARIERHNEHRFIRLFGCATNEICQVLPPNDTEPACSLFTKALVESIGGGGCASLEDLLTSVEERCHELVKRSITLKQQTPHLSYGESSAQTRDVLRRPLFSPLGRSPLTSVWQEFDPNRMHCLVVLSEYEHDRQNRPDWWGLCDLVRDAVTGETGERIWRSFQASCNGRTLVSGSRRNLPGEFKPSALSFAFFSVMDALSSGEALDRAVRAVAEADLIVFDVTQFEPAVMLLIGVRSACCQSLSICSHGGNWSEGAPLNVPFNLQDLNVNSHTVPEMWVGENSVVKRFVQRVETGFSQLAKHPKYLDLPGYDALRALGSDYEASSTIDVSQRVLMLCSYSKEFFPNWKFVALGLREALSNKEKTKTVIQRIIDYGTPQLVRQNLYEQIRRVAACVVDWSEYSPSVFVELGARLAVSEWGAVQIVDQRYLPDGELASPLKQVDRMYHLLNPIAYQCRGDSTSAFVQAADLLVQRNPSLDTEADYNRIHRVLLPVVGTVQVAHAPVVTELKRRADALHHPQQGRVGVPQVLFHGSRNVKQDSESMALELRIAAWLYMEHRYGGREDKLEGEMRTLFQELGRAAVNGLYDRGDDDSIKLAEYIEGKLIQPG